MVDPVDGRTAFEICLIQQRRDSSDINGLAVDNNGLHFYLGLNSGFIEEHKIVYGPNGCIARVCAKRQVSKKEVKSVCLLGGAGMLAVLIDDGQVLLCDLDQLEPMLVAGIKNVFLMACDPRYISPCRFAVTARSGIRKYQIEAYEITRGWDAQPKLVFQCITQEEIKAMAWLGDDIIVSSKSTYYLVTGNQVKPILQPRDNTLFTILPIPDLAVFLWEECLAVCVDAHGSGVRPPLTFDSKPLLLTQGGMCIVAVNEAGEIAIFDQNTSKLVQQLPFNVKSLFNDDDQSLTLHHTDTPSGSTILLASSKSIWMLRPVAHEAQTLQLLKSGSIEAALELAESCLTESWAEDVFAQAGLLLLQQRKWETALSCFQRCSSSVFQPSQLFPLFPKWTRKWANQVCLKSYWGLHRELTDLRFLTGHRQKSENVRLDDEISLSGRDCNEEKAAYIHIANYFLRARHQSNVHCLDGVDAVIIYLLSSIGHVAELESFVQTMHQAEIDDIRSHLVYHQRFISLALATWKKGKYEEALDVLKKLCFNEYIEAKAKSGAVYDAKWKQKQVATYYTAKILSHDMVDTILVEKSLKWLVGASPFRFLQVCQLRSWKEHVVLSLIPSNDVYLQFRYLHHIIHTSQHPTIHGHYHTKLAILLCHLLAERSDFESNDQKLFFMFAANDSYYQNPDCQVSDSQTRILHFDDIFKPKLLTRTSLEPPNGQDDIDELNVLTGQQLREIFQHHLLLSKEYDALEVLRCLDSTSLHEEQVILCCRLKNHSEALHILAITIRDIHSAIRYCKLYAGDDGFIKLLDMLLKPGDDMEPFYAEAIQVLNAESGNLDPMRVLDALSESMPLSLAYPTLARMLRERTHRKRQTKITHQLSKAQNVLYRAEKYDLESGITGQVYIGADTECVICRKPLNGRIFYKYPSGSLVCGKCQRDRSDEQH